MYEIIRVIGDEKASIGTVDYIDQANYVILKLEHLARVKSWTYYWRVIPGDDPDTIVKREIDNV